MGVVYEGHDPDLDRPVAIKILPPETGPDADVRRFQTEAKAAAKVAHPNCVSIYDIDEHDGRPFLVMELVRGLNAGQLVERCGPLPWATRHASSRPRAGLVAVHAAGLIHRDLKPRTSSSPTPAPSNSPTSTREILGQATLAHRPAHRRHAALHEPRAVYERGGSTAIGHLLARRRLRAPHRAAAVPRRTRLQVMFALQQPTPDPRSPARTCPRRARRSSSRRWQNRPPIAIRVPRRCSRAQRAAECGEKSHAKSPGLDRRPPRRFPVMTAITSALSKAGSTERDGAATRKLTRRRLLFAVPPALAAARRRRLLALRKPDARQTRPTTAPATPPEPPPTAAAVLLTWAVPSARRDLGRRPVAWWGCSTDQHAAG